METMNKKIKVRIATLIATTIAFFMVAISAIIFISMALYEENGVEITAETKSALNLIKYVNYEKEGKESSLLEFNLKEGVSYNTDYYNPVKQNDVYLKIPAIADCLPSTVEVISISSKATNGDTNQKQANYEYNHEKGVLHILASNEADENGDVYYGQSSDYDEYQIMVYYDDKIDVAGLENNIINVPLVIRYQSMNDEIGIIQGGYNKEITLEEKGDLISTEIKTSNIYNGYINSNIANGTEYETQFTQNTKIDISDLNVDEIAIEEANGFKTVDNNLYSSEDIIYKQIKINKSDIQRILGDDGYLQVLNKNGDILLEINKDTESENNEVVYNFENQESNINLKISKPINKGLIHITTTKAIKAEMTNLNNQYITTVQKTIGSILKEENNEENLIEKQTVIENITTDYAEIKNASTNVKVNIDNTQWTNNIANNANIVVSLVTSDEKYNLFNNPTIEIELPEHVEKVLIGESYLLNANGLSIDSIDVIEKENGRKVIVAKIKKSQTQYLFDNMIDGTNLVIPATIILEKEFTTMSDNISVRYENHVENRTDEGTIELGVNLESIIENTNEQENTDSNTQEENSSNNPTEDTNSQNEMNINELALTKEQIETLKQNNGLTVEVTAEVGENVVAKTGTDEENNLQDGIVYERQVIKYKVTLTNNTNEVIENISVTGGVPDYTNYATLRQGRYWDEEKGEWIDNIQDDLIYKYIIDEAVDSYQLKNINTLQPGETKSDYYEVVIGDLEDDLNNVDISNNITVNIGEEEYHTYILNNKLNQAEVEVKFKSQINYGQEDVFSYQIDVTNLTDTVLSNIKIETTDIPKELEYDQSMVKYTQNASGNGSIEDNKFKINLDTLESGKTTSIWISFFGSNYDENVNEVDLKMSAKATVNNTTYQSNENTLKAYPQYVTAVMSLDKEGQEIKYEDELTYTINVKNESKVKSLINVECDLPEQLEGIEATYSYYDVGDDIKTRYDIEAEANTEYELITETMDLSTLIEGEPTINIPTVLPAGKTLTITIKAKAGYIDETTDVSCFATVYGESIKTVVSNIAKVKLLTEVDWDYITNGGHEVENPDDENPGDEEDPENPGDDDNQDNPGNDGNTDNPNDNQPGTSDETYSISGIVWLDENEDGRRIDNEKRLTGVTVKLFNAETNSLVVINNNKMSVEVDENGEYVFNQIPNGKYYCLFEYDTENYEITSYQKSDVSTNTNNDVSKAEVNIDGVIKNVGITDVLEINNNNLTNIDLGLIEGKIFDLKLEKYISKVTVNNSQGNKEYNFDNTSLAKVEIASKYIEGSIVTIEYKFVVTNEGNIAGYANEITDYIPDGLSFSKTENKDWTVGRDGYARNVSLTSTSIAPGESKTLTLYLTKNMTKNTTGVISNSAEITQSGNAKNLKDIDSTVANKASNEDDYSSAEIIISIKTGFYRNTLLILLIVGILLVLFNIIRKYKKKIPTIFMLIAIMVMVGGNINNGANTWQEYINWVADPGILSNGWICSSPGAHQCAVGSHLYQCQEVSRSNTNRKIETVKDVELTKVSSDIRFRYFNKNYNIVGPYRLKCNYVVDSADVTVSLAGGGSYTICDSNGNPRTWSGTMSFNFYLKVPTTVTAVTSVRVQIRVENAHKITTSFSASYTATCIGVGGTHQNGSSEDVAVSAGEVQAAHKNVASSDVSYGPAARAASFPAVYAGSLKVLKKDAATGETINSSSGAKFRITNSRGDVVANNLKIGEVVTGLPIASYYVDEIVAPSDYKLNLQSTTRKIATAQAGSTVTVTFENQKYTNLEIQKVDEKTGQSIEGIGFTIYDNAYKKYITSSGGQTNTPTTIYTNANGLIQISNIKLYKNNSTFTVTEVESKNPLYRVDEPISATITAQSNATTSWSRIKLTNKKAFSITLNKRDGDNGSAVDATFNIKFENPNDPDSGKWITSSGEYVTSKSDINTSGGTIKIEGLKEGTYYVYETATLTPGYIFEMQDNYDPNNKWIDCGTITLNDSNLEAHVMIDNHKYVKIRGYVWLEQRGDTKATSNSFNNTYESNRDSLLSGIPVELVEDSGSVVASTTTNGSGEYEFETLNQLSDTKIIYDNLKNYYIRFTYDKENYVTVSLSSASNGSKAIPDSIPNTDLDDRNLIGASGYAITQRSGLENYYNESTGYVEYINLGLIRKIPTEYSINESIEYIKIVKGSYTFTYRYGNETIVTPGDPISTVNLQNSARSFTQKIYPSDIKYNLANQGIEDNQKYKVYVVYKIDVTNNTTLNYQYLYQEKALYLENLTNTYDTNRFQISNDVLDGDNSAISNDFGLWSDNTNSGTATFNINSSNKAFKTGSSGIAPNNTVSTYIEFRVTDEALTRLLTEEELREAPTIARATGYHSYTRTDSSWQDATTREYTHRTVSDSREDGALYLKWNLSDTRTVSGTVFEDDRTDESASQNTRIGDGKYDSASEKTVSDVIVSLIDANTGNVANLYDGNLTQDSSTGMWTTNKQVATVKADENGQYSLPGVVPGEYYLQFTYGDGKTNITDMNGNRITTDLNGNSTDQVATKIDGQTINSNYYKSTILTGAANTATEDNKNTWFLNSINEAVYSIATDMKGTYFDKDGNQQGDSFDIIESRTNSTKEMNYSTAQNKIVIDAISPDMDIQFEYVENKEIAYNDADTLRTNCTGMYFGIIERPHTVITLDKKITNVKLTLSNGSTIINGNPQDANVSQYLAGLSDNYAKIETDTSFLYGSSISISYELTATNESEIDYANREYYTHGSIDSNQLVKTTVTKIIDYITDTKGTYTSTSDNIQVSDDYTSEGYQKEDYFDPSVDNSQYKDQLVVSLSNPLIPESAGLGEYSTTYTLTVSKLLSTQDEDLGLSSYSEIIGLKNVTFTQQYESHSGNYKAADEVPYPAGTSESDNAEAIFAITPSTGANRSYTIYIVAGAILIILAGGVILIKKFVL